MNTQKNHTPGPWVVEINHANGEPEFIRSFIYDGMMGGEMFDIANMACDETGNATANARLIAAAPEMFELLYTVLPYIEMLELDQTYKPKTVAALTRRIRDTLDRAEGVQS
jgi:hypothetical protein